MTWGSTTPPPPPVASTAWRFNLRPFLFLSLPKRNRPPNPSLAAPDDASKPPRPAAVPPHYDAYEERRLAEEVLYLHSLWRSGPPAPAPAPASAPAPPAGGSRPPSPIAPSNGAQIKRPSRARTRRPAPRALPRLPSPHHGSARPSPAPRPQPEPPSPASLAQRDALRAVVSLVEGSNCQNSEANDIATVEILIEILQSTLTVEMHRHGNEFHMEGAIVKLLALIYNPS
ncbi:hypothetical protein ZWY2020_037313 [Hordeum vulgare]|nr:hypothetical protein ZWY2020_037313 [Hordeum vulgare]